jgi:hypothetical protein
VFEHLVSVGVTGQEFRQRARQQAGRHGQKVKRCLYDSWLIAWHEHRRVLHQCACDAIEGSYAQAFTANYCTHCHHAMQWRAGASQPTNDCTHCHSPKREQVVIFTCVGCCCCPLPTTALPFVLPHRWRTLQRGAQSRRSTLSANLAVTSGTCC